MDIIARYHRIVFVVTVLVLMCFVPLVSAQTFPLNKTFFEESVYCFTKESAIELANAGGEDKVFFANFGKGNCVMMSAVVTYHKRIHQQGRWRVYEGKIGTTTIYNPTTWKASGEADV